MLFEDTSRNGEAVRNSEPTRQRIKSGQPYSDDLRSRVISAIENGASYRQAAALARATDDRLPHGATNRGFPRPAACAAPR